MATSGREDEARRQGARPAPAGRWGVILAGGDGTRLRDLTRQLAGDDRPKQFCPLLGDETLLAGTRRRVALGIPPARTLVSVTSAHEPFYAPLLADTGAHQIVVQPENRGTAPAILYALLRVSAVAPDALVAILPSDHFTDDDAAFMAHVGAAFELAAARPDLVALLGIAPDGPETDYGWIEPGPPVGGGRGVALHRVRRFWEKPTPELARTLLAAGCLWNSFVMVGRVATLLGLVGRALPELSRAFRVLRPFLGTPGEAGAARGVYRDLPATDFSRRVLAASPAQLAVLPVRGVAWSDLGRPERVLALRGRTAGAWREVTALAGRVAAAG
jgi:mannose-1-phosphate guanylyltransferase